MMCLHNVKTLMGVLFAVAFVLAGGCGGQQTPVDDTARYVVERGDLKYTVTAKPREVLVGDTLTITLTVQTPEGYAVKFPTEDAFGGLDVDMVSGQGEPQPAAEGVVWRSSYTLEPLISGELEVPSLAVKYAPPAEGDEPAPSIELFSEPVRVTVVSSLVAEDEPSRPRDITGTLVVPLPSTPWWVWAILGAGAAVILVVGYVVVRGIIRWRSRPPPPIAPEIWALQALDALGTEDWFVRGEQREFYYRLNEIVRRYIELKFSLAAPDMTTQEFLAMLSRRERALPYDADRLRTFLEACDYVKYAAAEPGPDEAASVMATARAFIHATAAVVAESQVTTPTGGQVA